MEKNYDVLRTSEGEYQTTLTKKYKARKPWQAPDPRHILSFIPGTIVEVMVKEGQAVEEGDTLLTFKAMKMLNTYKSPISGTVAKVNVSAGDAVPKGVLLVEFV